MRVAVPSLHFLLICLGVLMSQHNETSLHNHSETSIDFITDELPPLGEKVEVLGTVGGREHLIPFLCSWTDSGWVISNTKRLLAFDVLGWRRR